MAVIIQQQRLADLIAIRFLRPCFHQDFALEHADGPIAQDLFEHLSAFTIHRIMGDEHRVIMVKIPITQTGAGHRYRGVIAQQLQHAFVASQLPPRGEGEGFKAGLCANLAKDMRQHVALIAVLHAYVVEAAAVGDVNLQNNIGARAILPGFNQGDLSASGHFDHMVNNCIALTG